MGIDMDTQASPCAAEPVNLANSEVYGPKTHMTDTQAFDWAWSELKKELNAERWNVGDEIQSWAFFKYGWDYRTQLELQRYRAPDTGMADSARLTDDEVEIAARMHGTGGWQTLASMMTFARAIEAAVLRSNDPNGHALQQEMEMLRKDAERYRLLRRGQTWSVVDGVGDTLRGDALDQEIDAKQAQQAKSGD